MTKNVLFEAENVTMKFKGTLALDKVSFKVHQGEVVGLIGENGAGKSTLLKIMIGFQTQTDGTMRLRNEVYEPHSPKEANSSGLGMVFQEQSLIVNLTVGQNVFFGKEEKFKKFGIINWDKLYKESEIALANAGVTGIKPQKKVSDFNFATRQMVEIAKVINLANTSGHKECLILLDEPTSVLNSDEVAQLFDQIRKLKAAGHGIVFVSHRLEEILEICDTAYVLKDGKNVGETDIEHADESKLYEMMVGRSSSNEYYRLKDQVEPSDEVVMEAEGLGLHGEFKDCSFKLYKGEILSFCGVVGSGKESIAAVLCGDTKPTAGTYKIKNKAVHFIDPSKALDKGVLMLPKERNEESIVGVLSVGENIALSNLKKIKKNLFISRKSVSDQAINWISKLRIKTSGYTEEIAQLSGGNAQKVVFARALASEADILILNHPTRGVDVGAKEEIYALIREIVRTGKSVILLADTLDESIGLSNRIIVMRDGLITGEYDAKVDGKPEKVSIVKDMM